MYTRIVPSGHSQFATKSLVKSDDSLCEMHRLHYVKPMSNKIRGERVRALSPRIAVQNGALVHH